MAPKTAAPAAKKAVKAAKPAKTQSPLFVSAPKSARVGGDIRPKGRDLSRFVRWPRNVRLQRQKKRLKVPPAVAQFNRAIDKNQASTLFKLLTKYQPETADEKKARVEAKAAAVAHGENAPATTAPVVLKFGLKHVTTLIEEKKAKLVVIAHDVDPLELVIWLPALCRKMEIPFCIVKGKARLGALTHQKNCAVVALTNVHKEDANTLATLSQNFHTQFNETIPRRWEGGVMGLKTQAKLEKRRQQVEAEEAKKRDAQK